MAKKRGERGSKDKGRREHHQRAGMGRLRRANAKSRRREGDLSRHAEDEAALERLSTSRRSDDTAGSLLAKFNRTMRESLPDEAEPAVVSGFDGQSVLARRKDGSEVDCQVRRVLKKMLSGEKSPLAIGDRVGIEQTAEGDWVIVGVGPRDNQLARADSHNKALEHVFAANVDRLVIVASTARPELKTGLIDRYLVIAAYNDIDAVIVFNKVDLADPAPFPTVYRELGYEVHCTVAGDEAAAATDPGTLALRASLQGRTCVFAGQSGVGKSSLVASLFPGLSIRIGEVSDALQKGRHTTTASRSYRLADGTCLIDTPGIRECGLTGLEPLDVALLYRDIAAFQEDCRFHNCLHLHEPACAVMAAVERGAIEPGRYASYLSILTEDLGVA